MPYALGAVKPHVRAAADYFGPKHGFKVVWGYRAVGSVPGSDHPKGLALDFMTLSKQKGDALVADAIAQAGKWGIKYIIYWRRIWQNGQWKPYSGPSPHTDHVHISFNDSGGSGGGMVTVPVGNNPLIPDAVEQLVAAFRKIDDAVAWITDADNWKRIGLFVVGFVLVLIALLRWDNAKTVAGTVIKKVKNA